MNLNVAFAGFDLFDVALESLLSEKCNIQEIFTCHVDGEFETNSHVIQIAKQLKIPCHLEPVSKNDLERLKSNGCDLFLSAGYYHKFPVVDGISMVNIHPSLLPEGRGAWPLPVMILNGIKYAGVSFHRIRNQFDTGEILLQEKFLIEKNDTLEDVTQKVRDKIPHMISVLCENLDQLYEKAKQQTGGSYWKCPKEEEWSIHQDMNVEEADRILRAFYGFGCIYEKEGKRWQIVKGRAFLDHSDMILEDNYIFPLKNGWIFAKSAKEL